MIREVDLVSYLPSYLQKYNEPMETLKAENHEFAIAWDGVNRILYNQFIATADEYGISRFEKILGILPFIGDDLEARRLRVQTRWFSVIPYTMKVLISKLINLCGSDGYTLNLISSEYKIIVRVTLTNRHLNDEIIAQLNEILPCNMQLDYSLLYNQHSMWGKFTHKQLSNYTHYYIRNEVT